VEARVSTSRASVLLSEFALWCNNYQKEFASRSWGLKDSIASQLPFARHRNTRSPLVRLASNTSGIPRVRAGQGAAYGVLAQTPSLTRMNEDPRICQALLRSIFNVDHYDFRSSLMTVICICFGLNNPLYSFYLAKTFNHLEFSVSVQLFYNSICIETNEHSKLHFKLLAPSANR